MQRGSSQTAAGMLSATTACNPLGCAASLRLKVSRPTIFARQQSTLPSTPRSKGTAQASPRRPCNLPCNGPSSGQVPPCRRRCDTSATSAGSAGQRSKWGALPAQGWLAAEHQQEEHLMLSRAAVGIDTVNGQPPASTSTPAAAPLPPPPYQACHVMQHLHQIRGATHGLRHQSLAHPPSCISEQRWLTLSGPPPGWADLPWLGRSLPVNHRVSVTSAEATASSSTLMRDSA
jgi:hypothetical protein